MTKIKAAGWPLWLASVPGRKRFGSADQAFGTTKSATARGSDVEAHGFAGALSRDRRAAKPCF